MTMVTIIHHRKVNLLKIPIRKSQRVFPLRAQYFILSPKDDEEDSLSVRDTLSDPAKENWQKAK